MNLLRRKWTLLAILLIVPVGLCTKRYAGPAAVWVNGSLGGVLYVIFWTLLLYLVKPSLSPLKNAGIVLFGTCCIEVLQRWHPAFLEYIRQNFFGRTLFGTTFAWLDMVHYGIGFIIAFGSIKQLGRMEHVSR